MIQYFHSPEYNKFTIAVDVPNKDSLLQLLKEQKRIFKIKIGKSFCNDKDQYVRSIGRDLSSSRIQEELFLLHATIFEQQHMLFYLINSLNERLVLKVFYNKPKVHFVEFNA